MIYVDYKPKDKRDLLKHLFSYPAFLHDGGFKGQATYKDIECTELHCDINKYRSFDDVEELMNTYYPDTEPKEIMYLLLTLYLDTDDKIYICLNKCSDIRRIVICYYYEIMKDRLDVIDNCFSPLKYDSKYSWKELLSMIGISNYSELEKFQLEYKPEIINNNQLMLNI